MLNTPELMDRHGRARPLLCARADGSYPKERIRHNFTGITARGDFLEYSHDIVVRNTTVALASYAALLDASTAVCAAAPPPGTAPGNAPLAVVLAVPAAAAAAQPALAAHLRARLRAGFTLVFDVFALAGQASYAEGTACAELISAASPYFRIAAVAVAVDAAGATRYSLALAQAALSDMAERFDSVFDWDPDTGRALAARRLKGQSLGDPRRVAAWEHARSLVTFSKNYGFNLNYNPAGSGSVIKKTIDVIPGTDWLHCTDCYFQANAGFRVIMHACFAINALLTTKKFDLDALVPTQYRDTPHYTTACDGLSTADSFDGSFSIEAYVYGSAGYNYLLTSDGIDSVYTTCATEEMADPISDAETGAPLDKCTVNVLEDVELDPLSFTVGPVPVTIVFLMGLDVAVRASAVMPGQLQMGSGASVDIRLGGGVEIVSFKERTARLINHNRFVISSSQVPTKFEGFTSFSGGFEAIVVPRLVIKLWNIIPLIVRPSAQFLGAVGSTNLADQVTGRSSHAPPGLWIPPKSTVLVFNKITGGGEASHCPLSLCSIGQRQLPWKTTAGGWQFFLDITGSTGIASVANIKLRLFGETFSWVQYGPDIAVTAVAGYPNFLSATIPYDANIKAGNYNCWLFYSTTDGAATCVIFTPFHVNCVKLIPPLPPAPPLL